MSTDLKNSPISNKVIFYLEDDKFTSESTTFLLKRIFNNTYSFFNCLDALKAIDEGLIPDIIISDIEMPEMTGLEFLSTIKDRGLNIPSILISAYNDSEYLKSALDIKVEEYIIKPLIDANIFIEKITKILEKSEENRIKNSLHDKSIFTKTDLEGNIVYVSNGFCDLSGYSKEELIGKKHSLVRYPNMPTAIYKNLWKTIQEGKIWKGELRNLTKNGNSYWIEHTISPEFNDEGKIIGFMSVSNDITKKKEFEDKHFELLQAAKHASIEDLIENISHQWRQPLSLISLSAGRLELDLEFKTMNDDEKKELLKKIVSSTQFLSDTIEKFSKFVSNNKILTDINISNEIKYVKEILKNSLEINKINLIDTTDYNESYTLETYENEISQILINLITNAKEAVIKNNINEEKWIKIDLKKDDTKFIITVEDNGKGIKEDIISKIFEPYFTTKFQSQGTGLGLHLTHRIISENLKGNISVSNSDYGAKFIVTIPIVQD